MGRINDESVDPVSVNVRNLHRGSFKVSQALEMTRMANTTIRVMHAGCVGSPSKGYLPKGSPLLVVAEYHGSRCYRIIGSVHGPSWIDALRMADEIAYKAWTSMRGEAAYVGLNECAPEGSKKPAKAKPFKFKRKSGTRKPIVVKTATSKSAAETDVQRLHVRDINISGLCQQCGGGDRMAVCKPAK